MIRSVCLLSSVFCLLSSAAHADSITFLSFGPDTAGIAAKEFGYTPGGGLIVGPGSASDQTGNAPGLLLTFAAGITGPGNPLADATLSLSATGFDVEGPATVTGNATNGAISQPLTTGSFTFTSAAGATLLTGTAADPGIVIVKRGNFVSGFISSGVVTYTGGSLFAQFAANDLANPGGFSISLNGIAGFDGDFLSLPSFAYGTTSEGYLQSFAADATGTFDATPIPVPAAAWAGMLLLGGVIARKRLKVA